MRIFAGLLILWWVATLALLIRDLIQEVKKTKKAAVQGDH